MTYLRMKNANPVGLICCIFLLSSCLSCVKEIRDEGYVAVEGGNIWYKIVGKEKKGTPILILHGGPGSRSCEMIPGFSLLATERPVIFYDQLGSGNSDRPTDTTLWQIERFVNEIDLLREALDLDELHMLGHSCGSAFLIEYLVTKKPSGIKSVIFSSPLLSTPDWIADANYLLAQLPSNIQDTIQKYESLRRYKAPAYLAATDSFYTRHLIRKQWPYNSIACDNSGGTNDTIYNYMWGPTEFSSTGTLLNFNRAVELNMIREPILFLTGEYDEARPGTMYKYQKLAVNASVEVIENAAHMTMIDQPERVAIVVNKFLNGIENKQF